MPSQLSDGIRTKFGGAISIEEANQLIFALFVSVDCLPDDLRGLIWDRTALASEFVALAKDGLVRGAGRSHEEKQYWSSTIDQILIDRNKCDSEFWKRLYNSERPL
jgi:hypothetical protein